MAFEYKCVGAPEKAKRKRGAKTRSDRVAAAMQEIIAEEAADGWEYLRTDLIPIEERSGMFGRTHEVHRAVLVFRRGTAAEQTLPQSDPAPEARPTTQYEPMIAPREPQSAPKDDPADMIKLAADRKQEPEPQSLRVPNTPPRGLS
jgi:hypothetical protein